MQLFSADTTIFSKKIFFCPQKVEKTTLKSCSEKLNSTLFSLLPELPNQAKQKNSCSKMWLIDQLYIELGFYLKMPMINNVFHSPEQISWKLFVVWLRYFVPTKCVKLPQMLDEMKASGIDSHQSEIKML